MLSIHVEVEVEVWLAEPERIVHLNKQETLFMNEINNSVFREGIGWQVSVFQDGDYALTMDSASLSTCQTVVPFGNNHRFKKNFCLLLKWQNFWQLNICKFHSFVISDLGNGEWQVEMGKKDFFSQNFPCLGLARNHLQLVMHRSHRQVLIRRRLMPNRFRIGGCRKTPLCRLLAPIICSSKDTFV